MNQKNNGKILILSRNRFNYSNKRFSEEAKKLGVKLLIADPEEFDLVLDNVKPSLHYKGDKLNNIACVIPRLGASISHYGMSLLYQFEAMNIPMLNTVSGIELTKNKLTCIQKMSQMGIAIPKTVVIRKPSEIEAAIKIIGGFPVVLKLISGTQGIGVMLMENMRTMQATLDTLWSLGQDIIIQECIKESLGKDLRIFVLNGKVEAAIRRTARIGDFRANYHRGAIATSVQLSEDIQKMAVSAVSAANIDVAGVDLLESDQGAKLIEINSSPGLEATESASGENLAQKILQLALDKI